MKIYFRCPWPEDRDFEADLPDIPRSGDIIEDYDKAYTVERVVWFIREEEIKENPYVILGR